MRVQVSSWLSWMAWSGTALSCWSATQLLGAWRSRAVRDDRIVAALDIPGSGDRSGVTGSPAGPRLRELAGRQMVGRLPAGYLRWLDAELDRAGRSGPGARIQHVGGAALASVGGVVAASVLALGGVGWPAGCVAVAGVAWCDSRLHAAGRRRRDAVDLELPDLLDTLAVVLGSGANLGVALRQVAASSSGPLCDELRRAIADTAFGVAFVDSFAALARRTGSAPARRLSELFGQCHDLGSPVSAAIVELATEMRRAAAHECRRRAARLAPRISLVVSTFIVAGSLILLVTAASFGAHVDLGPLVGG